MQHQGVAVDGSFKYQKKLQVFATPLTPLYDSTLLML
jgi:hypothetical protein